MFYLDFDLNRHQNVSFFFLGLSTILPLGIHYYYYYYYFIISCFCIIIVTNEQTDTAEIHNVLVWR